MRIVDFYDNTNILQYGKIKLHLKISSSVRLYYNLKLISTSGETLSH